MPDPYWTEIFDFIEDQSPNNCIVPPLRAFRHYKYKTYFNYRQYDKFDLFVLHKNMETWFDCEFLQHIFSSYSVLLENPVFIIIGTEKYKKKKENNIHINSFINNINLRHEEKIEDRKIVFMHIPKCAGTSLFNLLKHQYKRNVYFSSIEEFTKFNNDLSQYNVIAGHINLKIIKKKIKSSDIIWLTVLRNPIERFFSVVAHSRRESIENLGLTMSALREMNLKEFLKTKMAFNELHQPYRYLTERDYKKLREYNLSEISDEIINFLKQENVYFGFQDRLGEYINIVSKVINVEESLIKIVDIKANISKNYQSISKGEIDEAYDIFSKEIEVDMNLYNRAMDLYKRKYSGLTK